MGDRPWWAHAYGVLLDLIGSAICWARGRHVWFPAADPYICYRCSADYEPDGGPSGGEEDPA